MHKDGYPLGTRGGVSFTHVFPADGEYRFNFMDGDSVDAGLYPRGMETAATLVILVDGVAVARRDLGGPDDLTLADRDGPKGRSAIVAKISGIPAEIKAGAHTVTATFIERSWALSNDPTGRSSNCGMRTICSMTRIDATPSEIHPREEAEAMTPIIATARIPTAIFVAVRR